MVILKENDLECVTKLFAESSVLHGKVFAKVRYAVENIFTFAIRESCNIFFDIYDQLR